MEPTKKRTIKNIPGGRGIQKKFEKLKMVPIDLKNTFKMFKKSQCEDKRGRIGNF